MRKCLRCMTGIITKNAEDKQPAFSEVIKKFFPNLDASDPSCLDDF
jgi:hypothetical protein